MLIGAFIVRGLRVWALKFEASDRIRIREHRCWRRRPRQPQEALSTPGL